jgi:hypothetical protein
MGANASNMFFGFFRFASDTAAGPAIPADDGGFIPFNSFSAAAKL